MTRITTSGFGLPDSPDPPGGDCAPERRLAQIDHSGTTPEAASRRQTIVPNGG
jgi:hypothetical protein